MTPGPAVSKTVEALARAKRAMKIEPFHFVPTGWLQRSLSALRNHKTVETGGAGMILDLPAPAEFQ